MNRAAAVLLSFCLAFSNALFAEPKGHQTYSAINKLVMSLQTALYEKRVTAEVVTTSGPDVSEIRIQVSETDLQDSAPSEEDLPSLSGKDHTAAEPGSAPAEPPAEPSIPAEGETSTDDVAVFPSEGKARCYAILGVIKDYLDVDPASGRPRNDRHSRVVESFVTLPNGEEPDSSYVRFAQLIDSGIAFQVSEKTGETCASPLLAPNP